MDGRSFDDLTRLVADGSRTRRALVRRVVLGAGAAALVGLRSGQFGAREAMAAGDATCQAAVPSEFVSKNSCQELACGPSPNCLCAQTVGHIPTCVTNYDPHKQKDCPKEDECSEKRRCKNGFVCAKVQGCCGPDKRKCLRRCPT
jgi:hypothetical protein